jgi:hypothetical protein
MGAGQNLTRVAETAAAKNRFCPETPLSVAAKTVLMPGVVSGFADNLD